MRVDGRTDMTKLGFALCNFANAHKNCVTLNVLKLYATAASTYAFPFEKSPKLKCDNVKLSAATVDISCR
jgi:hypothetical protein